MLSSSSKPTDISYTRVTIKALGQWQLMHVQSKVPCMVREDGGKQRMSEWESQPVTENVNLLLIYTIFS